MAEKGVAVVSGGSRGIGRAFVFEAARRGWDVVFGYRSRSAEAADVVAAVEQAGARALAVQGDMANPGDVAALGEQALAFGEVSLLVNNAGLGIECFLRDLTPELWAEMIAVNLTAPCFLARALEPSLSRNNGAIVNISSTGGVVGSVHGPAYGATKAGLIGLTMTLARELAPHVRVNALAPGPVATEMWFAMKDDVQRRVEAEMPLRRVATPEDIARAGLDVASWPDATGQVITIDGGRVMR